MSLIYKLVRNYQKCDSECYDYWIGKDKIDYFSDKDKAELEIKNQLSDIKEWWWKENEYDSDWNIDRFKDANKNKITLVGGKWGETFTLPLFEIIEIELR